MIHIIRRTILKNSTLTCQSSFSFGFRERITERLRKRAEQEAKIHEQSKGESEKEEYKKGEENLTEEEKNIINAYKVDEVWNILIKEAPDHNFQKDIIVHKKSFEKTTRELRSAILFEDLLKSEIDILIYDTKGKPYAHAMLKFLYLFFTVGAAIWSLYALRKYDPKNGILLDRTTQGKVFKYSVYTVSTLLYIVTAFRYRNFRRKYTQKVIYNTQREEFTFTKRNVIGLKYNYVASRFKILYTENPFLNKQGTNYFDINTKEEFSIVYKDSWIKQDLFSHLISQRIRL